MVYKERELKKMELKLYMCKKLYEKITLIIFRDEKASLILLFLQKIPRSFNIIIVHCFYKNDLYQD